MIETISNKIEVFSLREKADIGPAVESVMNGMLTVLRVGSVFSLVFNPKTEGLRDKLVMLKGREKGQYMSVVCTYEQAKKIVDKNRVNPDFFGLSEHICSKAIIRIPVDPNVEHPFSYNKEDGTLQFLGFEERHTIRTAFREELTLRGCEFISITSANIHNASTIEDLDSAKKLAELFNMKSFFFGYHDLQTVVTDIPEEKGDYKGSYIILSFCNPAAIEVKRLSNKIDVNATERCLNELFEGVHTQTPLVYAL